MADTQTNPIAAMVVALERIRDGSVEKGTRFCQRCFTNQGHDYQVTCGIASRALEAVRSYRPSEDARMVTAVAVAIRSDDGRGAGSDGPGRGYLSLAFAAIRVLEKELGLSATPQPGSGT